MMCAQYILKIVSHFSLPLNFANEAQSIGYLTSQGCKYDQGLTMYSLLKRNSR